MYEHLIDTIREKGERLTIQRRQVIRALSETGAHMTLSDIRQFIEQDSPDDSLPEPTIYRILQWLKDLGLIAQTDIARSGVVYQVIGETPHHHLVCLGCGCVSDIPDTLFDTLRQQLINQYGFHPRIDHMAVYGYCAACVT